MGNQITSFLKTRNSLKTFSDSKYKVLSAGKIRNTQTSIACACFLPENRAGDHGGLGQGEEWDEV